MLLNYILFFLSALLFIHGFFPISTPFVKINNEPPGYLNNISLNIPTSYSTNVTKAILIIIDALRLDFVNPNYMPSTIKLMQFKGCFNKIEVEIPTVTLPRIKALTVGNVPQFMDVVMNLAGTEILADSIIHSALRSHKKIVFYGDDTWLKLFPDKFYRFEGTTSFFVRDFKEVDDNVTRNVQLELEKNDWDIMILHYLGLDHIGHVYGPSSPLIPAKLAEMDDVIKRIFEKTSITNENVLLMVTGDHGMKDSGGHGGSTFYETHVPLAVIGHNCDNNSFSQSDIPVNLAVLLGLPIPSLAIGKIHKSLIQTNLKKYLYALHYNSYVLKQKNSCCETLYQDANTYYLEYLVNENNNSALKAIDLYETYADKVSKNLTKVSMKQNLISLFIALFIMTNTLLTLIAYIFFSTNVDKSHIGKFFTLVIIVIQFFAVDNSIIVTIIMFIILNLILLNNILSMWLAVDSFSCNILLYFLFPIILHPFTFISSSYIEEEHQFWYFIYIIILSFQVLYFLKAKKFVDVILSLICLAVFRFLRTINSTGDKWANYPDTSDWLLKEENYLIYQLFYILSLTLVFLVQYFLLRKYRKLVKVHIINFLTLLAIFKFKQNESSIPLGRVVWLLVFIHLICVYKFSKLTVWILIISLLLKPYNVILVPYCVLASLNFSKQFKNIDNLVLYHVLMGNTLYFVQGHSNSLASVDISVGYIGLSDYLPVAVVGQVLCHTYAFPVLCHLLTFNNSKVENKHVFPLLFCNRLYVFILTSIVTFIFRHHLFIWSVFAPKLFIEFIHVSFLFIEYIIMEVSHLSIKLLGFNKIKNTFI